MPDLDPQLVRKMQWRILPPLFAAFLLAYLDRVNVGFAASAMNAQLGFGPEIYGFGAGVFFLGYALFEVPSNYAIQRFGAQVWLARIMVTWGVVSALTALVWNANSFYVARFALGVAEAGFFPGILFYLTLWFPASYRAKTVGAILVGAPLAAVIGAPLSGLILQSGGVFGLSGWQAMFVLEALPSALMGLYLLKTLSDGPDSAKWLSPAERAQVKARLDWEQAQRAAHAQATFLAALADPRIWLCGLVYMGINIGIYGILLWLPLILKSFGSTPGAISWQATLPYIASAVAIVVWTRRSDRTQQRVAHVVAACAVAGLCLLSSSVLTDPTLSLIAISLGAAATWAALSTSWALAPTFLTGAAMASGLAAVNALGQVGGFVGPFAVGYIRNATGSFSAGMFALAAALFVAALLPLMLRALAPSSGPLVPPMAGHAAEPGA